jgi:hypothetical protein
MSDTIDNPLRRRLLAGATAALAAGAAIATAAQAAPVASPGGAGDDAELLECCADMEAAQARMDAMSGPTRTILFRTSEEQEVAFMAEYDEWWGAFEDAVALPAKTPEGIRAKVRMAQLAQASFRGDSCVTRDDFISSLLADLGRATA